MTLYQGQLGKFHQLTKLVFNDSERKSKIFLHRNVKENLLTAKPRTAQNFGVYAFLLC